MFPFLIPFILPVAGAAVGVGLVKANGWANKQKFTKALLKIGPNIAKIYDVIDPILAANLAKWNGSQVDKAFDITIKAFSDGNLTDKEVKNVASYLAKKFIPQVAADKTNAFSAALEKPVAVTASEVVSSAVVGALTANLAIDQVKNLFNKK
jgi:hypothetical protein